MISFRRCRFAIIAVWALATCVSIWAQEKAEMIDSFGSVPNGDFRGRSDLFLASLRNKPDAKGIVYIYGTSAQIAARERLFQNHISFRKFDPSRIAYVKGRNVGNVRSDLWIVPAGAAPPELKPEAWIFQEIGQASERRAGVLIDKYLAEVKRLEDHQAYVINYGPAKQIDLREQWLRDALRRVFNYHWPRITFVNGGPGPVRTVMWLAPPGAKHPRP